MTASSRGYQATVALMRLSRQPKRCIGCTAALSKQTPIQLPQRRRYAVAAATLTTLDGRVQHDPKIAALPPVTSTSANTSTSTPYITKSGILLSRPPLLTQELHPFETAYYFYQRRLNERLALPFTRYFYYKNDTPQDNDWKIKARLRNGSAARDLGGYQAYGADGWNDEALIGQQDPLTGKQLASKANTVESLLIDSVVRVNEDGSVRTLAEGEEKETIELLRPLSRETDSDKANDDTKLDRKVDRTLYLLVQAEDGSWILPTAKLGKGENILSAAERIVIQSAGINMNTWIVGHAPIGHYIAEPQYATQGEGLNQSKKLTQQGEKVFFMKGRIMAGQANLKENKLGLKAFKWVTKEEMGRLVVPQYFRQIKNMMPER